ncbi:MAG TPA: LacI family DNA-binding transcriptional regulator [Salinibacter sp.]|nr:LacI family DNA-binding transcriptional regulator [Salinibacter sp.]
MPTPPRSTATINDVAKRAGVSAATVSRVVNDSGQTAEATRERVLTAIEELEYRPNRTAKSLAQGANQTIAVAVPTFTTPFHNELLKGVRFRLERLDIDLLLCDLEWEDPETSLLTFLERGAMDGLLAAGLSVDSEVGEEVRTMGRPAVMMGTRWNDLDSFYWDETAGARVATEHLLDQGHTRIGMITTHYESPIRDARIRGYEGALRDAGIEPKDAWVATGQTEKHAGFSEESGYEAMEALLDTGPDVTAIFSSSDVQAIGAWQALRHAGLDVPGDVALVGYDDIKVSRFIGLSTISQKMHDIGEAAADLLLRRLDGTADDAAPVSRLVTPELQVRRSSARSEE